MNAKLKGQKGKTRFRPGFIENLILVVVLPVVGGAVNGIGFQEVGYFTSHVTGSVARIGGDLAQRRYSSAWVSGCLVLTFFIGAMVATMLVESAKRLERARYVTALILQTFLLATYMVLASSVDAKSHDQTFLLACLLSSSMGMQNALVSNLSGAVVRTTHVTGIVTDIGIEAVRATFLLRDRLREAPWLKRLEVLAKVAMGLELRKLRLHLAILSSFLLGAVLGPALYLDYGPLAMLAPCCILCGLVVFDTFTGLRHFLPSEPGPEVTREVGGGPRSLTVEATASSEEGGRRATGR